jgi:Uma2 family endonuclease
MEEVKLIPPTRTIPGLSEAEMKAYGLTRPPTQDELPASDGMPMETNRHVLQMYLLIEALKLHWAGREDVFVGGNMFVYFSPDQVRTHDFHGPDFFAVQGVKPRERKSWVVWEEGKAPEVVIELLSESTAERDKHEKKLIYQDRLRVPEYFWFDPFSSEWAGFALREGVYQSLPPDEHDRLLSQTLKLALVKWQGKFGDEEACWLRWATLDGQLLPTGEEERQRAEQEHLLAEQERLRAEQERQRADEAQRRADELGALLARYRERFGELPE